MLCLIFTFFLPRKSFSVFAVLPVLHLLVFLFQKMFSFLVILFVKKLYVRNNTFKLKIVILPSKDNFLICHSFVTLHIILTVFQKLNLSSFFLLYHFFLHITPKIVILSLVSLIFVIQRSVIFTFSELFSQLFCIYLSQVAVQKSSKMA